MKCTCAPWVHEKMVSPKPNGLMDHLLQPFTMSNVVVSTLVSTARTAIPQLGDYSLTFSSCLSHSVSGKAVLRMETNIIHNYDTNRISGSLLRQALACMGAHVRQCMGMLQCVSLVYPHLVCILYTYNL